jgi:hypothetical protein
MSNAIQRLLGLNICNINGLRSALLTQFCWGDKIEKNEMGGACSACGEGRVVYRVLVGKPEGRRPLVRPRRRWEDNIRMDLREVGCGCVDWMEQLRIGTGGVRW